MSKYGRIEIWSNIVEIGRNLWKCIVTFHTYSETWLLSSVAQALLLIPVDQWTRNYICFFWQTAVVSQKSNKCNTNTKRSKQCFLYTLFFCQTAVILQTMSKYMYFVIFIHVHQTFSAISEVVLKIVFLRQYLSQSFDNHRAYSQQYFICIVTGIFWNLCCRNIYIEFSKKGID